MAGHQPIVCLVCRGPVDVLDRDIPVFSQSTGWEEKRARILVECLGDCKTVRLYYEARTRLDGGSHIKRSLR